MVGHTHATMDYEAVALQLDQRSAGAVEKRCSALATHAAGFRELESFAHTHIRD